MDGCLWSLRPTSTVSKTRDRGQRAVDYEFRSPSAPGRSAAGRHSCAAAPDHAAETEAFVVPGLPFSAAEAPHQPAQTAIAPPAVAGATHAADRGHLSRPRPAETLQRTP